MPLAPVVNVAAREYLSSLVLDNKIEQAEDVTPATFDELPTEIAARCFLANDADVIPTSKHYHLLGVVVLVDGEPRISTQALMVARDTAKEWGQGDLADQARKLLSEAELRRRQPKEQAKGVLSPTATARPVIALNSFVTWSSFGTVMRGRVVGIHHSGIVKPSAKHPGITATQENPVATICVYDQDANGFSPSERRVVRPLHALSRISGLQRPKINKRFEVTAKGKIAEMMIYGDIGDSMWGGLSAKEFREQLNELKNIDELHVRLNSGGGDAFEGVAIYNTLREYKAHKVIHIDGIAASIATIIACAGDVISMADASQYMIHRAWSLGIGNRNDMQKLVERLDLTDNLMAQVYASRTGQTTDDILNWMDAETWFSPSEAKEYGFVDEVAGAPAVAASLSRPWFKNGPSVEDYDAAERSQRRFLARGSHRVAGR